MKNKLLFTLLTTSATLIVTHPTINVNLMPDAVIYTKSINDTNGFCKLERSYKDPRGLQVCEYKCSNGKRGSTLTHTTSFNGARSCRNKIEEP